MEDEIESSNGVSLLPLAVAILAVVLGGAALYFGLSANQRLNPLATTLEAGSSSTARMEKDLAALQTQLAELSAQQSELNKALERSRIYSSQSERALKQLAGEVQENREQLVKLAGGLNELAAGAPAKRPAAASTVDSGSDGPEVAPSGSVPGSYTIRSGDTFARIASKEGVSLQALLDANPDANPSRLQIGQVIQLPAR